MKAQITFLFTLSLCGHLAAQSTAVVHQFLFRVDEELTTELSVDNKSRTWFPGYSVGQAMPEQLIDSMARQTEQALTKRLGMPVRMCYHKNKKGKDVGTVGVGGMIEGLPGNTFKAGKESCPGEFRYVDLGCSITAGGSSSIVWGNKVKTKVKPLVVMTMQVYDPEKNAVMKGKVKLKDFEKLRSTTEYNGPEETKTSETLTPYDIYGMYRLALAELMKQE